MLGWVMLLSEVEIPYNLSPGYHTKVYSKGVHSPFQKECSFESHYNIIDQINIAQFPVN